MIAISGLYPSMPYDYKNQVYTFIKYLVLFAFTVACAGFCFKVKVVALIAACCAGYALQHLSYQVMSLVGLLPIIEIPVNEYFLREHILELIVFPVTYVLVWAVFGRTAQKYEFYKNYDPRLIAVSVFILFICLVVNRFARQTMELNNAYVTAGNSLYAISCCFSSLFINFNLHALNITRTKNETLERIGYEERKQFEISKKNREQLNIKYHDLKHVISLLCNGGNSEEIAQYRKVLEEYDSEIRTGNETLDIVINEKVMLCRSDGISITFLGDGRLLSFISQYDVYSLFGNILDNAIEAVRKVEDKSKKIISLTIEAQGNCIVISSINYFVGKLSMSDEGYLKTTKTDGTESHGFGMRSIKMVSEKYGGDASFSIKGDIFELDVMVIDPTSG